MIDEKNMMKKTFFIITVVFFLITFSRCKEDGFISDPDALLRFSADTVSFDTVFTTIGSATMYFKIYNPYNKTLKLSTAYIAGGENSFFRMNFDGEPARRVDNIEIPPKDSLFIFVEVTIDPLGVNNPLIVKDSVIFITNGNLQNVKLIAYGQDVHLIKGKILKNTVWEADKPYLIYNSAAVDTGNTLTINPGVQVYLHDRSSLIVWGKLIVNGTSDKPVIFQGDRLEEDYRIIAGQWGTIYIDPISTGNNINYAIIKNSIAGIQVGHPSQNKQPTLQISNTIIQNVSYVGIYAFGADITCYNTILANATYNLITLLKGGKYTFSHCTFFNYGVSNFGSQYSGSRSGASVIISNWCEYYEYDEAKGQYYMVRATGDLEEATFNNSIIYGNYENEVVLQNNNKNAFNYYFDHCLIKEHQDSLDFNNPQHFNAILLNKNPEFVNDSDRFKLNFRLDTLSPAKDYGSKDIIFSNPFLELDYDGNSRLLDVAPDLGAFERKEE